MLDQSSRACCRVVFGFTKFLIVNYHKLLAHECSDFVNKLVSGKMKGLAFIKDPDGYWIEIFDLRRIGITTSEAA